MDDNQFKQKKEYVEEIIFGLDLPYNDEDKNNLQNLINAYFRLKKNYVDSKTEFIAGGLLWVYSKINFLFENNEEWSQNSLAEKLGIKKKSISRTASAMMNSLKIDVFDERFARKEIIEEDPRKKWLMTKEGFIAHKDDIKKILLEQMKNKFGDLIDIDEDKIVMSRLTKRSKKPSSKETQKTLLD